MQSPHHPIWIIHFKNGTSIAKSSKPPFNLSSAGGFQNMQPELEIQEHGKIAQFYHHLQELDMLIKKLKKLIDDKD